MSKPKFDYSFYEQLNAKIAKELKLSSDYSNNFGSNPVIKNLIPTGRPSLDFVTGGGFPESGIALLAGQKSSGKTSLALQVANRFEGPIAFLDTEFTTTTNYVSALGLDPNRVIRYKAENIEQMCNILLRIIPHYKVIIWDSITNIASNEETKKQAEERTRANSAIVLATQVKLITPALEMNNSLLMAITHVSQNQERLTKFDPKYLIPGGERLHHNSSLTLMLSPSSKDKGDIVDLTGYSDILARDIRVVCEKNKNGIPLRTVKTKFIYGKGYTILDDVFTAADRLGILDKSGSWYSFKDTKLGQGAVKVKAMLSDNPELLEEISGIIYDTYLNKQEEYTIEDVDAALELDEKEVVNEES